MSAADDSEARRGLGLRRRWLILVGMAATALAAGGIAYATIPDSNGIYTACMLKGVGTLRLIDPSLPTGNLMSHCTSLETQLSWGKTGPPGAQGAQGPQGVQGPPGPAGGSSDVYTSHDDRIVPAGNTDTVVYLTLPAGTYALSANVTAIPADPTNTAVASCSYSTDGNESFAPVQIGTPPGGNDLPGTFAGLDGDTPQVTLSLVGTVVVVDGDLGLDCFAFEHDIDFHANITAISVGERHEQVH